MKKTLMIIAGALTVLACSACNKEHQCKCLTATDAQEPVMKVFVVGGSIGCEDIKTMALEKHSASGSGNTLVTYDTVEVECRPYGD